MEVWTEQFMIKDLDKLFDEVMDELLGADNYADCALGSSDATEKKLFSEMAKQELSHSHNLREIIANRVAKISTDADNCKAIHAYLKGKWDEYERKITYKISQIK